ncbi:hypothetical protein E3N88_05735 [Mikania micrantha]|uniref:Uncharacterized protein n=1 Tax=Mikania micrantha TaxID=192012 RepID=A0A5N6PPR2_9ASTR|nr:hypothetical protein E3N88_05735 [Mikania micrantha]
MTMGVSFTVSKKGVRFRPKSKPETPTVLHDEDVGAPPEIHKNQIVISTPKPSDDAAENGKDVYEISDADVSFFINLFPDGYSIGNPSENRIAAPDDPKFLHPYDRTSESLFLAIERGLLPADFLDDIPCKYINGAVACEVRDYRNCAFEQGVNGSTADSSHAITTKTLLKMSLENVVKDIPLISDSSWTYGDLMEAEARILIALHPKLDIDPTPNLDRLCRPPTCTNLNLNIRELRRKRLRQMAGADNSVNGKKVCMDRALENPSSGLMVQPSDIVNMTTQNVIPSSTSLSYQSKYQIGVGNTRVTQDNGSGPVQDMMNPYPDGMNSNLGKRENQDGQLSPMNGLAKRARPNSIGLDGNQQQKMDGFNSLMQPQQHQQSIGRGIPGPYNAGIQKYPFEGSFNQEPFTMGQTGTRYNLKQEPVDSELNRNMLMDPDVDPRLQQQQRLAQQFTRSSFPPTPWNTLDNSRKEEQFQRRKSAQSPRVSSGALPQSPLSSKSGEFSSGSHGGQYGAPAPMGSSQRDKSAVTSVPTIAGPGSLTSNAQMAARGSNSLPKTPAAMSGVGSPASVGNISGTFNASSPLVGKEADKSMRDKFAKIEALTVRYQLNMKKNKVDECLTTTTFPTQQLRHYLFNDLTNENLKDEACKMPLSKSLLGGSMNVCKTRVLNFVQTERMQQGNGFSLVPKSRTRMILSEKRDDGCVAMHYGELDDCDYLASEECLPTLPNTHIADLLAAQFCTLISREGYLVDGDHLQPKPSNTTRDSGDQLNNNASGVLSPNIEMPETVSGQPSHEIAKPSDSGSNNNASGNSSGARMHPPANSQPLQISHVGGLLPPARPLQPESQPSFQQNQHNLMQQQLQRSSATMLASNPLSHLNALGQNSNMQQLGHMLNKTSPLQLRMLQQQQQQQQPQMQRKMMMGLGNVGMGGGTGNNMVGLQGMGNVMGGTRGISPPMSGVLTGMGNNMGQNPIGMNQAASISNAISQRLMSGMITPAQAHLMNTKLRMVQQSGNMLGGAGGQSGNIPGLPGANRPVLPGSSNYSMLGPNINRANNMNQMQRTAMAPPKLMSGMNAYMNQQQQMAQQLQMHVQQPQQMPQQQQQQLPHQQQQQQQESASPLQAVLSPPPQVGSPSMGLPQQQQASPQQMSQRTPMSPQLSSGAIHPPMSAGNQEANCPASPQLSSQTMGSVSSITNSPMDMQGVNKSS